MKSCVCFLPLFGNWRVKYRGFSELPRNNTRPNGTDWSNSCPAWNWYARVQSVHVATGYLTLHDNKILSAIKRQ